MYKRLTNNNLEEYNPELDFCADCKYYGEPNGCNRPNGTCGNYDRFIETYNRLAELEDKIENRTLMDLPCKVGDTVWRWVIRDCYDEWTVDKICFYIENGRVDYTLVCSNKTCGIEYFYKDDKDIEWTFNKPKAEAEKKLKELKNE